VELGCIGRDLGERRRFRRRGNTLAYGFSVERSLRVDRARYGHGGRGSTRSGLGSWDSNYIIRARLPEMLGCLFGSGVKVN
jgi:hypothetical protein